MAFYFLTETDDRQEEATPTMTDVLKQAMESHAAEFKVAVPAEVIKRNGNKLDVRPYFKRKYEDGTTERAPIIYNVPIAFYRADQAFMAMPIVKGCKVLLFFSDRSLEEWLSNGKEVSPADTRFHDISDAIAYPGLYPFNDTVPIHNTKDIIIKNQNLEFRIKPTGKLQVLNSSEELVKVLYDMLTILREARVYTSTGPQLLRHEKFEEITERLKTFLER